MSDDLQFTGEEMALIDGVIGTLYPKMSGASLQRAYWTLHEHLQSGIVNEIDLQRIESALAFADPGRCTACHMEGYRELTTLLLKTKAMLRAI